MQPCSLWLPRFIIICHSKGLQVLQDCCHAMYIFYIGPCNFVRPYHPLHAYCLWHVTWPVSRLEFLPCSQLFWLLVLLFTWSPGSHMHNLCGFPDQKMLHSTWSVGLEGLLLPKHSPCKHPILWQSRNGVFAAVFFLLELLIKLTSNAWVIFKPYSSNNCVRIHVAISGFCTKFELSFTADWTARDKCKFDFNFCNSQII